MIARRNSLSGWLLTASLLVSMVCAVPGLAQPTVVQNDSITTVNPMGSIQAGFVANESAAAWLDSPCDGDLIALQVLWLSATGGAPQSLEQAIRVYEPGVFPEPGPMLLDLPGPLMNDGFFNEFPVPVPLAVNMNDVFVVEFEFLNSPGPLGPSVVTDSNGCQQTKNSLFAIPPSLWFQACSLGLGGDFAIRAVVNCTSTMPNEIFEDGFELGTTAAWSVAVP